MKPFSLYVHIPFCLHKCPYCDFNTYALPSFPEREYTAAILAELDFRAELPEWRARTVQTIFFGGGTPSLFSPNSIRKIIAVICRSFPVDDNVEISLEANPGTVSQDSLAGFKEAGINRISIGAQSFNPEILKRLGRMHSGADTEAAVLAARAVGINNINLDIIFGAPTQTLADLQSDLLEVGRLAPQHVSPYGLTIEKGTPFYSSFKKGSLRLPKEPIVIEMMQRLTNELKGCGLHRYEISNYSLPGREARHNLAYWNGDDYLGLGAGAHSFSALEYSSTPSRGRRWSNYALPTKYIEHACAHGTAESWAETLTLRDTIFEYFFLGLRKISGVSLSAFTQKFGLTVAQCYPAILDILKEEKLLFVEPDRIALTAKGLLLADSVIENFADPIIPNETIQATAIAANES